MTENTISSKKKSLACILIVQSCNIDHVLTILIKLIVKTINRRFIDNIKQKAVLIVQN